MSGNGRSPNNQQSQQNTNDSFASVQQSRVNNQQPTQQQQVNHQRTSTSNNLFPSFLPFTTPFFPMVSFPSLGMGVPPYVPHFTPRKKTTTRPFSSPVTPANQRPVPSVKSKNTITSVQSPATAAPINLVASTSFQSPLASNVSCKQSNSNKKRKKRKQIPWNISDGAVEELAMQCIYNEGLWDPHKQKSLKNKRTVVQNSVCEKFTSALNRRFGVDLGRTPTWEAIKNRVESALKEWRTTRSKQKKITGGGDRKL